MGDVIALPVQPVRELKHPGVWEGVTDAIERLENEHGVKRAIQWVELHLVVMKMRAMAEGQ